MTEAEALRAQLDRIEAKLDRLGKLEERQNYQSRQIEKVEQRLDGHDTRLASLEMAHATHTQQANSRWGTFGKFVNIAAAIASTVAAGLLLKGVGL